MGSFTRWFETVSYTHLDVYKRQALGLYTVALIARLLRDKMIEVMGQDYIRLAIAKGVKPKDIVLKHALRNAILPIITIMGPTIAALLTGSFVIEQIFTIPGLGKYFVQSINDRDYTTVSYTHLFYSVHIFQQHKTFFFQMTPKFAL